MEQLKQQIYEEVRKQVQQKRSNKRIQDKLFNMLKQEVPMELILEIRSEIKLEKQKLNLLENDIDELQSKQDEKDDGGLKQLANSDTPHQKYDVSERHYIFYKDDKPYKVLISTVREIFSSYSKHGKDMSGEEIRQKFRLPAGIFELIKSATGLYKSSHIDDPVTLSRLEEDGLEDYIEGRVEKTLEDKYINVYQRATHNKKERDLAKLAKSKRGYTIFLEQFDEAIKSYKPISFDGIKIPEQKNKLVKDVFITDAHLGKLGTDKIVERFKKMTDDLVNTEESTINITFGGDAGECFLPIGSMHPGQRELGMERIEVSDLIMFIVNVFEEMLVTLYKAGKTVTFNGMGGNHDRFTEKKEFDPFRTPAVVIYKFLQKLLQETSIKINILSDKANTIISGNIKYIFLHGDGLSLREIKDRALAQVEKDKYLVIVSGDKHHFAMLEISDRVLRIQSPALAGEGKYDKDLALSSLPGCLEFFENGDGLLEFTLKRYK